MDIEELTEKLNNEKITLTDKIYYFGKYGKNETWRYMITKNDVLIVCYDVGICERNLFDAFMEKNYSAFNSEDVWQKDEVRNLFETKTLELMELFYVR